MIWLTSLALVLVSQNDEPVAVVTRFLELLNHQPVAASAMLDPQGIMAVHHIGGELTIENLPFQKLGCVARGVPSARSESTASLEKEAVWVDTHWLCPTEQGSRTGRPLKVTFAVAGPQIAGAYFEFGDITEPWPPR